jgi:hypothetical protein
VFSYGFILRRASLADDDANSALRLMHSHLINTGFPKGISDFRAARGLARGLIRGV